MSLDLLTLEQYRFFYSEEIRAVAHWELSDALVHALATVKREQFLGPPPWAVSGEWLWLDSQSGYRFTSDPRDLYHNVVVALKSGQRLNNGQPSTLAGWLTHLDIGLGDRVFHVGCGSGYYTAIISHLVGPRGTVVAVETDDELAVQASKNLEGYFNVKVHHADGATFDPGACDAILVNAGVTHLHLPWLNILKDSGRMILPLTVAMSPQLGKGVVLQVSRAGDRFTARFVSMVSIFSSTSVRSSSVEPLLIEAFSSKDMTTLQSIRLDSHTREQTCLLHASEFCLSSSSGIRRGSSAIE